MKLLAPLTVLSIVAAVTLSSCQKNWTCNCTTKTSISDSVISTGSTNTQFRATRNDAKGRCSSETSTGTLGPFVLKTEKACKLD